MVAERWDRPLGERFQQRRYDAETRQKIQELESLGATMSPNIPPEVVERIHAYEFGPKTTDLQELGDRGIAVPPADGLSDEVLSRQLRRIINGLADLRVFLTGTNHLSDRALYGRLEEEILRTPHGPTDPGHGWTVIDLLGAGESDDEESDGERPLPINDRDRTLPRPAPFEEERA